MSIKVKQTTVMDDYHHITQEGGARKHTRVALLQYDGEYSSECFFILVHGIEYSNQPPDQPRISDTVNEYLIRNGREAMIRTINLWNSVIMEKDYEANKPVTEDAAEDFPF